jgi:hypothetical protein
VKLVCSEGSGTDLGSKPMECLRKGRLVVKVDISSCIFHPSLCPFCCRGSRNGVNKTTGQLTELRDEIIGFVSFCPWTSLYYLHRRQMIRRVLSHRRTRSIDFWLNTSRNLSVPAALSSVFVLARYFCGGVCSSFV